MLGRELHNSPGEPGTGHDFNTLSRLPNHRGVMVLPYTKCVVGTHPSSFSTDRSFQVQSFFHTHTRTHTHSRLTPCIRFRPQVPRTGETRSQRGGHSSHPLQQGRDTTDTTGSGRDWTSTTKRSRPYGSLTPVHPVTVTYTPHVDPGPPVERGSYEGNTRLPRRGRHGTQYTLSSLHKKDCLQWWSMI